MHTAAANTAATDPYSEVGQSAIRKMRWRLLPYLVILYIIAMLDRANIGFAQLTMSTDLGIDAQQFGMLAGIFFIGYFAVEIPSNILMHRFGARIWIARILITWGIIAGATGFAHTIGQIYVIRFLLGVAEGGFMPGIILYITYWFPQRERASATAFFMMALPLSGILGAPVSGLILDHIHWMGIASWRWMLILEAVPAIILGVVTLAILPNRPGEAKFLNAEEKAWVLAELEKETAEITATHSNISIRHAFANARVWFFACIYFLTVIAVYALSFWMPQVVKQLSTLYTNTTVGFLAMIPPLFGLVAMIIISRHSDRTGERCFHAGLPIIIGGLACLFIGKVTSPFLSISLFCLMAAGIYNFYGPFWVLPSRLLTGYAAASGIAIVNSVGNLGGFVSPNVIGYITKQTGNMFWGLVFAGTCMIMAGLLTAYCRSFERHDQAKAAAAGQA